MYNILICDDDADILRAVQIYLTHDDYHILTALNGRQALEIVQEESIHLLLLDIMMPVMDGIQAMTEIRKFSNVPIILLTAKSEDTDKVWGLMAGADDYITKPFQPIELQARVRSVLRRYMQLGGGTIEHDTYTAGGILLNHMDKSVELDGQPVRLTKREYDILYFLMKQQGRVFSPQEIYQNVWGEAPLGAENSVAVHMRHLREKLEYDPGNPRYLISVWGHGYKLEGNNGRLPEK